MLKSIHQTLQMDSSLAYALATRIWQALAGFVTAALLIHGLSLPELGVYYTIISIVGIQAYFELGLLNILVSYSGHEFAAMAKAETEANEIVDSDSAWLCAAARMRDLIRAAFLWFGVSAVIFFAIATASGCYTLSDSSVEWVGPLLSIVPIAAVSVALGPAISILEGAGYRSQIYQFRFVQAVIGNLVVWGALYGGFGLWALVASALVQALMAAYITFISKSDFFKQFGKKTSQASDFSWSSEVLPVQWRMALISTTFHFATQCFVIIVTMFHGDAAAAPMGMTLSMTSAIQMLALAWIQSKYSVAAAHHGAGDREVAGTIWRKTAVVSTSILVVAFIVLIAGVACLPMLNRGIEKNFLEPWQVCMLGLGCLANHVTAVQGFYVLSRKHSPLLVASLIGSVSTGLFVWTFGCLYGTNGVVISYAAAMTLIFAPAHTIAYLRFRRRKDDALKEK